MPCASSSWPSPRDQCGPNLVRREVGNFKMCSRTPRPNTAYGPAPRTSTVAAGEPSPARDRVPSFSFASVLPCEELRVLQVLRRECGRLFSSTSRVRSAGLHPHRRLCPRIIEREPPKILGAGFEQKCGTAVSTSIFFRVAANREGSQRQERDKAGMKSSKRGRALRPVVLEYLATAWRPQNEGFGKRAEGDRTSFIPT